MKTKTINSTIANGWEVFAFFAFLWAAELYSLWVAVARVAYAV